MKKYLYLALVFFFASISSTAIADTVQETNDGRCYMAAVLQDEDLGETSSMRLKIQLEFGARFNAGQAYIQECPQSAIEQCVKNGMSRSDYDFFNGAASVYSMIDLYKKVYNLDRGMALGMMLLASCRASFMTEE